MKLASRMNGIAASATLAIKAETDRLKAAGRSIVDLGLGEPDFDTPLHVKEAAHRAIDANFTHYTATAGIPELRLAIADACARKTGTPWAPEQVVVGCGAKNVLFAICQSLFGPGDEVAYFSPYWVSYPEQIKLAGALPVAVPTEESDRFTPRAAALAKILTPRTRGVILNSPCNPSGSVIPPEELGAIADLAARHGFVVISDEVYEAFTYDGAQHASMGRHSDRIGDRLLVVSALSKSYAMTGWRVGYAAGPKELVRAIEIVMSHDASQAASISQRAALAAITGPQEPLTAMREEYEKRRDIVLEAVKAIPGMRCDRPAGAFYLFPNVREVCRTRGLSGSAELAAMLIREAACATVPGEAFGREGYLRISYAASREKLKEGMAAIRHALA